MALQCGIIGITGSGKTTIFNCLSNNRAEAGNFSGKPNVGNIQVPDYRLFKLEELQPTEKIVHATVTLVDIPGLIRGGANIENSGNRFLSEIRNTDALIHVVRCFDDPSVPHPDGSVNPVRDIENVELELQARDLESIDKRIPKIEKQAQAGDKEAKRIIEVLRSCKSHLESFQSLSSLGLSEQEKELVADLFLLTFKPVLYVCNINESAAASGNKFSAAVDEYLTGKNTQILLIAGKLEAEIAELEEESDRIAFLEDVGLVEPGVNKMVRAAYELLNLRTFFTVGPKEIKAWTIKLGMTAPQAAGVIHSDLERGFIRAEVMRYDDFVSLGSEHACKEKGKLSVEGKNYVVQDGDILHIRFNV